MDHGRQRSASAAGRRRSARAFVGGAALGLALGVGVAWLLLRPASPPLPRQYEVVGTVSAVSADGRGFALKAADGSFLGGFGLDYETPGRELIRKGARVRITVLAGAGLQEIVARVAPAPAGPG